MKLTRELTTNIVLGYELMHDQRQRFPEMEDFDVQQFIRIGSDVYAIKDMETSDLSEWDGFYQLNPYDRLYVRRAEDDQYETALFAAEMQFAIQQSDLKDLLDEINRVFPNGKPSLPILSNVLIEAVGSSLRLSVNTLDAMTTVYGTALVGEEGVTTVPFKYFRDMVRTLSPERLDFTLDPETQESSVRCGATEFTVKGTTADEYPPVEHNDDVVLETDTDTLRWLLERALISIAKEDRRPVLTGVYFELEEDTLTLATAASDDYRLSVLQRPVDRATEMQSFVVQGKPLQDWLKTFPKKENLPVVVSVGDGRTVSFALPKQITSILTLEGRFPDLRSIVPKSWETKAVVYTDDLTKACKRAAITAKSNADSVSLRCDPSDDAPDTLTVFARSAERGEITTEMDAAVYGASFDGAFNVIYIQDFLKVVGTERVVFQSGGPELPSVFLPDGEDGFTYVVMPMSR